MAGQHLARAGLAAQPRGQVERPAPIPALNRDGLAGVQPDADAKGKRRVRDGLIGEPSLEVRCRPESLAGGGEHGQRLVPPQLDDRAPASLHPLPGDLSELGGQLRRRLVTPLLGEHGVAADIGDQESADLSGSITVRVHHGGVWVGPRRKARPRGRSGIRPPSGSSGSFALE